MITSSWANTNNKCSWKTAQRLFFQLKLCFLKLLCHSLVGQYGWPDNSQKILPVQHQPFYAYCRMMTSTNDSTVSLSCNVQIHFLSPDFPISSPYGVSSSLLILKPLLKGDSINLAVPESPLLHVTCPVHSPSFLLVFGLRCPPEFAPRSWNLNADCRALGCWWNSQALNGTS